MYVLGIETSCDETSAAIVKDGSRVISNVVSSSLALHRKYGGVIPEIASRMQLETITQVCDQALNIAQVKLKNLNLISVTSGPGLLGSLLVGISFAKSLSLSLDIPLLGVDHLHGHIYACVLRERKIPLPFVSLVVSGGHTSLYFVRDFNQIALLGSTNDDAAGEAFDKVAKILGLGYPGGPLIESLARKAAGAQIKFNCSDTDRPLDFSFSGIKTAVLYYVKKHPLEKDKRLVNNLAFSFQEAVVDTLIKKSLLACRFKKVSRLVIGGGVAANGRLREKLSQKTKEAGLDVYFPEKEFCMDNAAMVAGLGYRLFRKGRISSLGLSAELD